MNIAAVRRVDVCGTYFDIEMITSQVKRIFFEKESDGNISMNYVMSKPYAIEKARNLYQTQRTEHANLYVSKDAIKVKQIRDYLGEKIFTNLDEELSGWLFFFDRMPFANWDHPCKYLLMIEEDNYQEIEYQRGLDERVRIEQIY